LLAVDSGWILNKTIPTTQVITRLSAHDDSLMVQTTNGIYVASITDPNSPKEWILNNEKQLIPMSTSQQNNSYAFMGLRFINYH
jgi:hypothetical protein